MASGKTYSILFLCGWLNFGQFIAYFNIWRWRREVLETKASQIPKDLQSELAESSDDFKPVYGKTNQPFNEDSSLVIPLLKDQHSSPTSDVRHTLTSINSEESLKDDL